MYAIKFTICSCSKKNDEILVKALMGVRDMGAVLGLTLLFLVILDNLVTYHLYIARYRKNQ